MDIPLQALGKATAELDSFIRDHYFAFYIVCHFLDSAKVANHHSIQLY